MVIPHVANDDGSLRSIPSGLSRLGGALFFLGTERELKMIGHEGIGKTRHQEEDGYGGRNEHSMCGRFHCWKDTRGVGGWKVLCLTRSE